MRTTTKYGLVVPSSSTDLDDIPAQLGALADQIDGLITSFTSGSVAAMPTPSILNRYYFVDSGTGAGSLYRDTGTAWVLVTTPPAALADITTSGFGDSPATGTAPRYAPADHRHGSQSNPVIPHVAATDPHPQYDNLISSGSLSGPIGGGSIGTSGNPRYGSDPIFRFQLTPGKWRVYAQSLVSVAAGADVWFVVESEGSYATTLSNGQYWTRGSQQQVVTGGSPSQQTVVFPLIVVTTETIVTVTSTGFIDVNLYTIQASGQPVTVTNKSVAYSRGSNVGASDLAGNLRTTFYNAIKLAGS